MEKGVYSTPAEGYFCQMTWRTLLRASAFGLSTILSAAAARAEDPTVDISLVTNWQGYLEVRLRPDGPFDGIVSTVLFTIRWDAATDAHLGSVSQPDPAGSYIPISKSDTEIDADGFRYQIFSGVGFSPMQWIPTAWEGGQEYTVAVVHIASGSGTFEIVDDAWTEANNGEFFVSLGGFDRTGIIYPDQTVGVTAGTALGLTLDVQPNPTVATATILLASDHARDVQLDLTNAAGQEVWHRRLSGLDGLRRETIDLGGQAAGVYLLRLRADDQVLMRRVIKR